MPIVKQDNYDIAVARAFEEAARRPEAALAALGARSVGQRVYELPVLNSTFVVNLQDLVITFRMGGAADVSEGAVGVFWGILALHYLCGAAPGADTTAWATFSDFQDIRGYESVYKGRVIGRFCASAGRTSETLRHTAEKLGGMPMPLGDLGYHFQIFPKVPLRLVYYEGDGELPAGATFLYPADILQRFPLEDVIVLAEGLVSRLQGKGWA